MLEVRKKIRRKCLLFHEPVELFNLNQQFRQELTHKISYSINLQISYFTTLYNHNLYVGNV